MMKEYKEHEIIKEFKRGTDIHMSKAVLEDWHYLLTDFEIGEYWAFVIDKETCDLQYFEKIPMKTKVPDIDGLINDEGIEWELDIETPWREEGFTLTDRDEAWILKIKEIDTLEPCLIAEFITPIHLLPEGF